MDGQWPKLNEVARTKRIRIKNNCGVMGKKGRWKTTRIKVEGRKESRREAKCKHKRERRRKIKCLAGTKMVGLYCIYKIFPVEVGKFNASDNHLK